MRIQATQQDNMMNLEALRRTLGKYFTDPVVTVIEKTRITPNTVTCIGLLVTIAAAVLIAIGHPFIAGFVVIFAGLFDMLDGALARRTNRITRFGGVLDSTLDRLSEAAVLIGISILFVAQHSVWGVALAGIALISSQLVSYLRAKAEALNINCEIGIFTRPERVVILSIGLLLSKFENVLIIVLAIIAVLSVITSGQRLYFVWKNTRSD
jgi:CDP-diacylglycerol--glycerol-3-phosphate 3-phosphatidyltransferase